MRFISWIIVGLVFTFTHSYGQGTDMKIVHGLIQSDENKTPLAFANVVYGEYGTTTNIDGEFVLTIPLPLNDNLTVKYIGYTSKSVDLNEYNQELLVISLEESVQMLDEIKVYTAEQILQDVDNYHQINYEFSDQQLQAYYKETIYQKGSASYIAEGLFDIYQPTIYSSAETSIGIIKSRKKEILPIDSTNIPIISGHTSDMIEGATRRKNSFLSKAERENYNFQKEDLTTYDGHEVFIISFSPKNKKGNSKGLIYIDTESKAVIKTEYYPIIQEGYQVNNVKWIEEYAEHNGTWQIQRVSYHEEWKQGNENLSFDALLVITDSKSVMNKPDLKNKIKDHAVFFNEAASFSDNFWEGYNYVKLSHVEKGYFDN